MAAHKLDFFLDASPNLHTLRLEAQKLERIRRIWEEIAPPALLSATHPGALQQGVLTIYVDNGAIAAKLKQQAQRLLVKLRERALEVTAIRFEVQVRGPDAAPPQKQLVLSQAALESLEGMATDMEDSPLRDALQRLVGHHAVKRRKE